MIKSLAPQGNNLINNLAYKCVFKCSSPREYLCQDVIFALLQDATFIDVILFILTDDKY